MAADQVDVEYLPITSTLTKIRVHSKNLLPPIQNEILCYPITNVTKPIDLFAPFPKQSQTFVPVSPPNPPRRISSKDSSALKEYAETRQINGHNENADKKVTDPETITVRNRNRLPASVRSRSASSITTSFTSLKDEKNYANSSRIGRPQLQRVSSLSPIGRKIEKRKSNSSPIAFGRSISKERTFAEEKKKQEECLPLCRRAWTASTNILRDPFISSPKDVRDAVRTTYQSPQTRERLTTRTSTRQTPSGNTIKTSAVTYAKDKLLKNSVKNDEKIIRLTTVEAKPKGRVAAPPIVVKSNLSKSSVSTETKLNPRSKQTIKTSSNISLARTNSTYSIDSSSSKRRIRNRPYTIKSAPKSIPPPVTISNKARKKKIETKATPITRSVPEEKIESIEVSTRTVSPTRSGYERSSSFFVVKDGNKKSVRNEKHEQIGTKSDKFFQNLFLRNIATNVESTAKDETLYQNTAVQEKAQFWNTIPRRANSAKKKSPSIYLTQKQPVSGSKFKELDRVHSLRQARSLSPRRSPPKTIYFDRINKYNTFYQLSDDDDGQEFGFDYHYHERSKSEPRSITYVQSVKTTPDIKSGESTVNKQKERPFSPTREIRSPSSRRIQSFRAKADSHSRAQSADSHRRYHSLDLRLTRRHSLHDENSYDSHLDASSSQSEKFKDLNRFYSKVERVGELERTTSNTDLHPIRKENELIDFDVWKQVRDYERAERELHTLVGKLKRDEREKDFLFRPKYPEDIKWDRRNESGLRVKEKSVEDLKSIFIERALQNELDEARQKLKDQYRSLWKGNSVLDLASSMVVKYNSPGKQVNSNGTEDRLGISRNLISTLSKDQVSKIKNQLTEIYSNSTRTTHKTDSPSDEYIINVSEERNIKPTSLLVRSNSLVGEKELLKPVLQRQENRLKNSIKADSISAVHETRVTRSVDRYDSVVRRQAYTEEEKRKLLQQLGNEIRDKLKERREKVLQPRETRGAIAAEKTNIFGSSGAVGANESVVTVHHTEQKTSGNKSVQSRLTSEIKTQAKYNKIDRKHDKPPLYIETRPFEKDIPKIDILIEQPAEKIKHKIEYFEKKKNEEAPKTIYLPRDDSSPDEEEVIRVVEEKVKARRAVQKQSARGRLAGNGLSTSESDLKEIFGEKESVRNLIEFRSPSPANTDTQSKNEWDAASIESYFRSRSISPICNSTHSTLKKTTFIDGDDKFLYESSTLKPPRSRPIFAVPPRRFKSDPTLNETIFRNQGPSKIVVKSSEAGDVSFITHKFELKKEAASASASRGRTRSKRVSSPIQRVTFKKEDRLMPHIDIISKTIALKEAISRSSTPPKALNNNIEVSTSEVDKIRHKFETQSSPDRLSLIGQMYTSTPDISELKDISNYLSSTWIAHKYSKPNDNARSATEPEKGPASQEIKRKQVSRSNSTSPLRTQNVNEMLKPLYDIFADQNYDPMKHRPTHRYVPVDKRIEAEYLWRRLKQQSTGNRKNVKASIKSEG